MKKMIAVSMIVAATMAGVTAANAANLTVQGYHGWAQSAMNAGDS